MIVGPTAVGKTALSIQLAKQLEVEIISGDSMQVYKGMDIGTGKITAEEKEGIPHHLIDIKEPDEPFSVAEYQKHVQSYIHEINTKSNLPILVGGSGLYIQSVLYNYHFSDSKRDEQITNRLEKQLAEEGIEPLYEQLLRIDPEHAQKIHPNNHRRVIRALEVYETTGLTMSKRQESQSKTPIYDYFIVGLEMERKHLYEKINQRVDQMVADGLVEEVAALYEKGYENTQAMQAIGYKEIIDYLKGEVDLTTAVESLKQNSRRYAKRQYTWFKNKMNVSWYGIDNTQDVNNKILNDVKQFLDK